MSTLLEQASLVMIPSGYKEDTVYSVIPTTGAGDLSFTRASNGTRINSAGLVEVIPYNLVQYSEEFNNAYWGKYRLDLGVNTQISPRGVQDADTFTSSSGQSSVPAIVTINITYLGNTRYSYSVYAKKIGTTDSFVLAYVDNSTGYTGGRASYNLTTQSITITQSPNNSVSASMESVGNGWYRLVLNFLTISMPTYNYIEMNIPSINTSNTFAIWGAQLNIGSTAKEYFPTTDRLNVPRLDYSNGSCPALLLEKQSTNLALWSEDFSNAIWTKQEITISANSTTAPDGTMTADKCIPTTLSSTHQISSSALIASSTCAFGVYAKAGGYNTIHILDRALASNGAIFDLSAGTVTNVGSGVGTITSVGNGWYRCMVVATTTGIRFYIPSTNGAFVGDGTSGVYLWGAQLEASSYATSYIPTTSASATRVADRCLSIGTPLLLNDFSIFISIKFSQINQPLGYMIFGSVNSASISRIYIDSGTNMSFTTLTTTTAIGVAGLSINTDYKICFTRSGTTLKYFRNGVLINTFTVQSEQFNFTTFCNAVDGGGDTSKYNTLGFLKEGIVFPNALTNEEAINLTAL